MQEKDLIKQLKSFRQVKPNKDWVSCTKKQVFEGGEMTCIPANSWLFLHRPSFIVGAAAVGLLTILIFVGTIGGPVVPTDGDYNELASITSALEELETSLDFISNQLEVASLDVSNSPDEILVIKQTVESTIEQGEEFLAKAKQKAEKFEGLEETYEVLTALAGAESALEEMKQINSASEKQVAERELAELKNILLNDRQKELLERAEKLFSEENYQEALMTVIEISQNN